MPWTTHGIFIEIASGQPASLTPVHEFLVTDAPAIVFAAAVIAYLLGTKPIAAGVKRG